MQLTILEGFKGVHAVTELYLGYCSAACFTFKHFSGMASAKKVLFSDFFDKKVDIHLTQVPAFITIRFTMTKASNSHLEMSDWTGRLNYIHSEYLTLEATTLYADDNKKG